MSRLDEEAGKPGQIGEKMAEKGGMRNEGIFGILREKQGFLDLTGPF
jgi:hypothetical protein